MVMEVTAGQLIDGWWLDMVTGVTPAWLITDGRWLVNGNGGDTQTVNNGWTITG